MIFFSPLQFMYRGYCDYCKYIAVLVDYCINNFKSCLNGATCVNLEHNYQCICALGYTGYSCETSKFK